MIDRDAQPAGDGRKRVQLGVAARLKGGSKYHRGKGATIAGSVDLGAADVRFHADDDRVDLPVESDSAAAVPPGERLIAHTRDIRNRAQERSHRAAGPPGGAELRRGVVRVGDAPSATALDADIDP